MKTVTQTILYRQALIEYSAKVEHPDRFELNSLTAKTEQSSRRD